jgi:predicted GNAT family acetyltransferase
VSQYGSDVTDMRAQVRMLGDADRPAVLEMIERDPVGQCVLHARLTSAPGLTRFDLGGQLWGLDGPDGLHAAVYSGGNLVPVGGSLPALRAIAGAIAARPRTFSAIVGHRAAVDAMWGEGRARWGEARAIRAEQPLMVTDRPAAVTPDPQVEVVTSRQLGRYLPAALAMFSEELDVEPPRADARSPYRARMAQLISAGRAFARFDDAGRAIYKAEIAAVSPRCTQIQGVWVDPDLRGRGVGTAATAAVLAAALRLAPVATLYVNGYNQPARAMYERLGFQQAATFATVLF